MRLVDEELNENLSNLVCMCEVLVERKRKVIEEESTR